MRLKNASAMLVVTFCGLCYIAGTQVDTPVPVVSQSPIPPADPPIDDSTTGTNKIQWVSLQEAKNGSMPIWVHFTADGSWCPPCEQLALETTTERDIVKTSRRFNCVLLKVPGRIAERWGVMDVPYDYFITPDFKARYRGTTPVANFSGYLERQAMKFKEYWK